jgi:hypothetical protein
MKRLVLFVLDACRRGHVYVDMDGCLLHKMPIPGHIPPEGALDYWMKNLGPTGVVKRRLAFLYFLKILGVELHLWTNRSPQHELVTRASLGRHYAMFASCHYGAGKKREVQRLGPCIDDEERNVGSDFHDLLVSPTRCERDLLGLWTPPAIDAPDSKR